MKIYHVIGTVRGYDTYSDFVCVAASAEDARRTYPCWDDVVWDGRSWVSSRGVWESDSWDKSIEGIKVVEIGDAAPGLVPGVICSSFLAG